MTSSQKNESKGLVPRTGTRVPERRISWPRPRPPRRTSTPASPPLLLMIPRSSLSARRRSLRLSATLLVPARPRWTRRLWTSARTSSTLSSRRTLLWPTRRWLRSSVSPLRRWALLSASSSRTAAWPALRARRRAPLRPSLSPSSTRSPKGWRG